MHMTITSLYASRRLWLSLGAALALCPAFTLAQQTTQPPKPAASSNAAANNAALLQAQRNYQAQQAVQQQHLQDQLQKNQVQEQQRQRQAAAVARPFANDPATTSAINATDQAQRDRYDANQRDAVDRYRSAVGVTPTVLPPAPQKSSQQQKAAQHNAPQQSPSPQQ